MAGEVFRKTAAGLAEVRGRALGPDAVRLAEPLRGAVTPAEVARAPATWCDTMPVPMGRKLAEKPATQIAHGP